MATGTVYLDVDDEITSAAARIRGSEATKVALVIPYGSRIATSRMNFRLLSREAIVNNRRLSIVASDAATRALAASAGLPVFASVAEYDAACGARGRPADAAAGERPRRRRPARPRVERPRSRGRGRGGAARARPRADAGAGAPQTPRRSRASTAARRKAAPSRSRRRAVGDDDRRRSWSADAPPPVHAAPRPPTAAARPGRGGLAARRRRRRPSPPRRPSGFRSFAAAGCRGSARRRSSSPASRSSRSSSSPSRATSSCRRPRSRVTPRDEPIPPISLTVRADPNAATTDADAGIVPAERLDVPVEVSETFDDDGRASSRRPGDRHGHVPQRRLHRGRTRSRAASIVSTQGGRPLPDRPARSRSARPGSSASRSSRPRPTSASRP